MVNKKKAEFRTKWREIDAMLHEHKNALQKIFNAEQQLKGARQSIGTGIDRIYRAINAIINEDDKGD